MSNSAEMSDIWRKKNSYLCPKVNFELREILFIEKFNKEEE